MSIVARFLLSLTASLGTLGLLGILWHLATGFWDAFKRALGYQAKPEVPTATRLCRCRSPLDPDDDWACKSCVKAWQTTIMDHRQSRGVRKVRIGPTGSSKARPGGI